ncbi:MAG TPA: flagellar hook-associated protein FlgK, partial [Clostridia bacterium]|nr:flagellar hook-associated protein FlgK [Clostridia bacterium]
IQQIRQIRDDALDNQYRRENRYLQEWSVKKDVLTYIEDIFNEPSDTGLSANMAEFFSSLQELEKAPESIEIRTLVVQNAIKLTESINHISNQLTELQINQEDAIETTVKRINDIALNIRDLNLQIYRFERGGQNNPQAANDLRDRRNLLLDELSGLVNLSYYESDSCSFRIDINGYPLVDHDQFNPLETVKSIPNPAGTEELSEIRWKDSGIKVDVTAGMLKGLLDARDGIDPDNIGIPYIINQLDTFARALAAEFNRIHSQGYTIPINGNPSVSGVDFFSAAGYVEPDWPALFPDWDTMTAQEQSDAMFSYKISCINSKNITIDSAIEQSVLNIAASSEEILPGADNRGNNENVLKMLELRSLRDITLDIGGNTIPIGNLEDFIVKTISALAVESSHSQKMFDNQTILTDSVQNRRMSVSGVSIDEEMADLMRFQHAYSAAARMLTSFDEMLETLILRTGLVGR